MQCSVRSSRLYVNKWLGFNSFFNVRGLDFHSTTIANRHFTRVYGQSYREQLNISPNENEKLIAKKQFIDNFTEMYHTVWLPNPLADTDHDPIKELTNETKMYTSSLFRLDVSRSLSPYFTKRFVNSLTVSEAIFFVTQLRKLGFHCTRSENSEQSKLVYIQFIEHLAFQELGMRHNTSYVFTAIASSDLKWSDLTPQLQDKLFTHIAYALSDAVPDECIRLLEAIRNMDDKKGYLSTKNRLLLLENTLLKAVNREKDENFRISRATQHRINKNNVENPIFSTAQKCHALFQLALLPLESLSSLSEKAQNVWWDVVETALFSEYDYTSIAQNDKALAQLFFAMRAVHFSYASAPSRVQTAVETFLSGALPLCVPDMMAKHIARLGRHNLFKLNELSVETQQSVLHILTENLHEMSEEMVPKCLVGLGNLGLRFGNTENQVVSALFAATERVLSENLPKNEAKEVEKTIQALALLGYTTQNMSPKLRSSLLFSIQRHQVYLESYDHFAAVLANLAQLQFPHKELPCAFSRLEREILWQLRGFDNKITDTLTMLGNLGIEWSALSTPLKETVLSKTPPFVKSVAEFNELFQGLASVRVPHSSLSRNTAGFTVVTNGLLKVLPTCKCGDYLRTSLENLVRMNCAFEDLPNPLQNSILRCYNSLLDSLTEAETDIIDTLLAEKLRVVPENVILSSGGGVTYKATK